MKKPIYKPKDIERLFQMLADDHELQGITLFLYDSRTAFADLRRIRVQQVSRFSEEYRVRCGRLNYAEREYFKRRGGVHGARAPKLWLRYFKPLGRKKK
jgi:hypothetical protein